MRLHGFPVTNFRQIIFTGKLISWHRIVNVYRGLFTVQWDAYG
jgi:hypothetical protein